jgi:O-antigen/teichoic acid export membrane protein
MKAERLIFNNTLTLGIGKAVGDIAIFLFLIYFSRSFGRDALGQYAFAMATGGLLSIFVSLGLNTYTVREISKDTRRAPEFVGQLFVLRSICALFCLGLLWLIVLAMGSGPETQQILLIIGAYHFLQKLIGIFNAGFMAHEEMMCPAILGILERMIILIAGSIGIYYSLTPTLTLTVYPASAGIVLVAAYSTFLIRHGRPAFRFNYRFIKTAMHQASPFLLIIILAQFYDRIGLIILTVMKGEAVVGIFMAGDRLLATINGFSAVFATALFPSVSRLSEEKREDLERLCAWALRMVFIFLFPLATMIYILSDQIILLAFGDQFGASAAMLRIGCWSLVLFGFNRILSIVLIAFYRQDQLVRIRIAGYIGYFFFSILLVWKFSYLGLVWSKIITETGLFLLTLAYAVKVSPSVSTLNRFRAPAALCLLFAVGFMSAGGGPLPALVLFFALFAASGMFSRAIRAEDFKALKTWLIRRISGHRPDENTSVRR